MPSHSVTTGELRNMTLEDLRRDIRAHQALIRKMRIGIEMSKEKDSGKYRREKKALARMMTVLTEKTAGKTKGKKGDSLQKQAKSSKMPSRGL